MGFALPFVSKRPTVHGYNPVAAAAQNSHNEILKQTVSPEGTPLPESMASLPLKFSKISKSHAFVFLMQ
jgi:hypothetical protein